MNINLVPLRRVLFVQKIKIVFLILIYHNIVYVMMDLCDVLVAADREWWVGVRWGWGAKHPHLKETTPE